MCLSFDGGGISLDFSPRGIAEGIAGLALNLAAPGSGLLVGPGSNMLFGRSGHENIPLVGLGDNGQLDFGVPGPGVFSSRGGNTSAASTGTGAASGNERAADAAPSVPVPDFLVREAIADRSPPVPDFLVREAIADRSPPVPEFLQREAALDNATNGSNFGPIATEDDDLLAAFRADSGLLDFQPRRIGRDEILTSDLRDALTPIAPDFMQQEVNNVPDFLIEEARVEGQQKPEGFTSIPPGEFAPVPVPDFLQGEAAAGRQAAVDRVSNPELDFGFADTLQAPAAQAPAAQAPSLSPEAPDILAPEVAEVSAPVGGGTTTGTEINTDIDTSFNTLFGAGAGGRSGKVVRSYGPNKGSVRVIA